MMAEGKGEEFIGARLEDERLRTLHTRVGALLRQEIINRISDLDQTLGQYGVLSKNAIDRRLQAMEATITYDTHRHDDPNVGIIIYSDADNFKSGINDLYGQHVGDEAIRELAMAHTDAIRSNPRKEDFVGSDGGDEFVTLIAMREREGMPTADKVARDVIGRIQENCTIINDLRVDAEHPYVLSCSFGVALCRSGDDFLMRKVEANMLMKQEKQRKRAVRT